MNHALVSSKKMDYCTPQALWEKLDHEFHFTLDVAATSASAKCSLYFTPQQDGLSQSWAGHTIWCNPPYGGKTGLWVKKAFEESRNIGTTAVMLIGARTETGYYHDYIFPYAEIRWIRGKLVFEDEEGNPVCGRDGSPQRAPFPSAIIIFK